jgi:hypothetical protein
MKIKMINKQLNQLTWEQVSFLVRSILAKSHLEQNYNPDLQQLIRMFVKEEVITYATLMDLYSIQMHVFHDLIDLAEDNENYELCGQLLKIILIEKKLYLEWIMAMTDEDIQDESLEEYNYTNLFFQKYKTNE